MAVKRMMLELGSGCDSHGGDYTKAAVRAVDDAVHHSSLGFVRALDLDLRSIRADVTVGVQRPDLVDPGKVKSGLAHDEVTVTVVRGGLDIPDEMSGRSAVIASAAGAVGIERP